MSGIFNCFEDQEMSFQDISQKNKIYQIVIQSTEFYNWSFCPKYILIDL